MAKKKSKPLSQKLNVSNRNSLIKKSERFFSSSLYDIKTVKLAYSHLKIQLQEKSWRENCESQGTETRVDNQTKLRCRQLPNVVQALRKSVMRQDWDETATLLMILCHSGLKLYKTLIIKTCFLLLFTHKNSNLELLKNFIRNTTGYILDEDIVKFIRILFTLRKIPLTPLERGKYIRKTGDNKVTRDPEFKEL